MNLQDTVSKILKKEVTLEEAKDFANNQFGVLSTFLKEELNKENKELIGIVKEVSSKMQEHQKVDSKIIAGYTLAANIEGFTEILNKITRILVKNCNFSD